jgi:sarcosine oxidase delta subunit
VTQYVTCPDCGRRVKVEFRDGHWQRYGHRTDVSAHA